MALPRAVVRGLLLLVLLAFSFVVFNIARAPNSTAEGVWDASSWADRRTNKFGFGMEENPNLMPEYNTDTSRGSKSSGWSFFGGATLPQKPERPLRDTEYPTAPRPLSRPSSNHTYPRVAPGTSRIVIPGTSPEEFEEGPLPTLTEALAHLKPKLMEVKERHGEIPREHMLWEPIFSPSVNEELQERYWHLRETWDEEKKEWVMKGDRRWMLVTVCRQVAGE